jgi:hypothetical protein
MIRSLLLIVVALGGCDLVFDLERGDGPPPSCGDVIHDEDEDGVRDLCDNCPGVANPLQENIRETNAGAIADGVGDACDPRPTLGGDYIERLQTFSTPTDIGDWQILGGAWSVVGDQMVFDEPAHYEERVLLSLGAPITAPATIEIHLTVATIDQFQVYIGATANADAYPNELSCTLHRQYEDPPRLPPTLPDEVFLYHPDAQATTSALTRHITNGSGYRLALTVEPMRIGCVVQTDDGQLLSLADQITKPFVSGNMGLISRQSKVEFDYVVVYGITAAAR